MAAASASTARRAMARACGSPCTLLARRTRTVSAVRILLVDDDRELIDLLAFALKRAGLEPIAAHDGSAALRLYEEREPDLVVLDINLGGQSGLDVLRDLRRRGQLPVIMLTALDSEEDKVRGL